VDPHRKHRPHQASKREEIIANQLKEYAQAEGVLAKLGIASELGVDLSRRNGVPETVEYCEQVPHSSARPHIDLVPGRNGSGMRLTRADI
jgi:hypothetical protein